MLGKFIHTWTQKLLQMSISVFWPTKSKGILSEIYELVLEPKYENINVSPISWQKK